MRKISLLCVIFTSLLTTIGCNKSEEEISPSSYDLTGVWINVGDEYDTFTFKEDKSGSYYYSYLTEDTSISTTGHFENEVEFNLYLTDYLGDGTYTINFFADSDFPIYNATFKIIDGYLQISYDWLDTEGHDVTGIVEAYRPVE